MIDDLFDFFDIRVSLGESRSHFVRDESTVVNVYIFQMLADVAQFNWNSLLRANQLRTNR